MWGPKLLIVKTQARWWWEKWCLKASIENTILRSDNCMMHDIHHDSQAVREGASSSLFYKARSLSIIRFLLNSPPPKILIHTAQQKQWSWSYLIFFKQRWANKRYILATSCHRYANNPMFGSHTLQTSASSWQDFWQYSAVFSVLQWQLSVVNINLSSYPCIVWLGSVGA